MQTPAPVQPKPDIKFHDRLDLVLHTDEYVDQPCGTISNSDGKPRYCSNECPTLRAAIMNESKSEDK